MLAAVLLPSVGRSSVILHRLAHRLLQSSRSSATNASAERRLVLLRKFCVSLVDLSDHVACVAFIRSSFTAVVFKSSFCDCRTQQLGATRSIGADRGAHLLGSGIFTLQ